VIFDALMLSISKVVLERFNAYSRRSNIALLAKLFGTNLDGIYLTTRINYPIVIELKRNLLLAISDASAIL